MAKFVLVLLFLIMLALPIAWFYDLGYVLYGVLVATFLVNAITSTRPGFGFILLDLVPASFVVCWFYGLVLALAYGNDRESVIRNFAGMTCYGLYFIFRSAAVSRPALTRLLLYVAFSNMLVGFVLMIVGILSGGLVYSIFDLASGNVRVIYSGNVSIAFCVIAVSVFRSLGVLDGWQKYVGGGRFLRWLVESDLFFYLSSFYYIVLPYGRGFIINYFILMVVAPVFSILITGKFRAWGYVRRSFVLILFFLGYMLSSDSFSENSSAAGDFFRLDHRSNETRLEQGAALREEFTFLGAGLGAPLKSRYSRDERGYGFEQSYENLMHKVGLFSVILFFMYAYTVVVATRAVFAGLDMYSVLSLALGFCFLIPSAGNPMLFAPVHVALHCISLYLSRCRASIGVKERIRSDLIRDAVNAPRVCLVRRH